MNYTDLNKASWNRRVAAHVDSDFYQMESFLQGATSLNEIELKLFPPLKGLKVLHLQCHFGQDTLSLQRMGAQATGVDFSESAIEKARELNEQLGLQAKFICSDVNKLTAVHQEQYDLVFTSYGVIGWLEELDVWAHTISQFLKPGGQFIMVEFHPVVWMFDDAIQKLQYSYFNKEVIIEELDGTYASKSGETYESATWNHSFGEVLTLLLDNGLKLTHFGEYDYSPYDIFPDMTEVEKGKFKMTGKAAALPLTYSLTMQKP